MAGKHKNWHRDWQAGDTPGLIRHSSGLAVQFARAAPDLPDLPEVGALTRAPDGSPHIGRIVGGDAALAAWLQARQAEGLRDPGSLTRRLARLMREAGDWYAFAVFGRREAAAQRARRRFQP